MACVGAIRTFGAPTPLTLGVRQHEFSETVYSYGFATKIIFCIRVWCFSSCFFALFATGPLAWNTIGYWLFVGAVFCLAFALYGRID
jgi:hypothetical protein